MPQIAPMNWLMLYFLFTIIFLMFNFINYYMFIIKNSMTQNNKHSLSKMMNWKW
uniref:ATP synthase complex subunit 8 n=1 Tax=Abax parallelepipedus TaxID=102642 RepID=A0A191ZQY5_ABAPA|nr:ATP synthase F0 subunit 8 [Abax parallelepipedus]ANJ70286.1 ATP synthase F0 subunit 8 [Abax parallelepipedus]